MREQVGDKLDLAFEDLGEQQRQEHRAPGPRLRRSSRRRQRRRRRADDAASLPLPDKPSIAVLPFANMSGDPEQEYFTDGITEDIITELSRFRSLFVIARNSSFAYKGRAVDVQQVGRELGVRFVSKAACARPATGCASPPS